MTKLVYDLHTGSNEHDFLFPLYYSWIFYYKLKEFGEPILFLISRYNDADLMRHVMLDC